MTYMKYDIYDLLCILCLKSINRLFNTPKTNIAMENNNAYDMDALRIDPTLRHLMVHIYIKSPTSTL